MQNNRGSVIQAKWILKWIIVVGIFLLAIALRGALFSICVRDYNIYMSPFLALLIFGVIIITSWDLVKLLFSTSQSDSA